MSLCCWVEAVYVCVWGWGLRACVRACVWKSSNLHCKDKLKPKHCLNATLNDSKSLEGAGLVFFFRDDDPLVCAIRQGDLKAFNDAATSAAHCLLRENKDGWMPLHDAAFCGQRECLKTILKGRTYYWTVSFLQDPRCTGKYSPSDVCYVSWHSSPRLSRQAHAAGTDGAAARRVLCTLVMCAVSSGGGR